jgi:hypothetical protein
MPDEMPEKAKSEQAELRKPRQTAKKLKKAIKELDGGPIRAREGVDLNRIAIEALLDMHNAQADAVAVLMDCLGAERTYYDLYSKSMVTEPDYGTRQAAARTLLEYKVGKPVIRQQILVGTVETEEQLAQKLKESPALCDKILAMIGKAKATP